MKCPYCNFELTLGNKTVSDKQVAVCRNPEYKYAGWHLPAELWQELIRTRKAVDIAVERLELIAHETFQGEPNSINMGFHVRAAAALTDIDEIIAEQKD